MKFRVTQHGRLFYPERKGLFFWRGIPVRMHTWDNIWVYYADSFDAAYHAIEVYKEKGDRYKDIIIEVD